MPRYSGKKFRPKKRNGRKAEAAFQELDSCEKRF